MAQSGSILMAFFRELACPLGYILAASPGRRLKECGSPWREGSVEGEGETGRKARYEYRTLRATYDTTTRTMIMFL